MKQLAEARPRIAPQMAPKSSAAAIGRPGRSSAGAAKLAVSG